MEIGEHDHRLDKFRRMRMPVKPLFTLICDDVRIESSNKLVIVGLYNNVINFMVPSVPVGQGPSGNVPPGSGPVMQFALPFLTLVRRWIVTEPGKTAKTAIIDPTGKSTPIGETQLVVPPNDEPLQEVLRIAGIILVPGPYTIRTTYTNLVPEVYDEVFEVRVNNAAIPAPQTGGGAIS
jgi:hypothetical protein